jgi:hypothetical protein
MRDRSIVIPVSGLRRIVVVLAAFIVVVLAVIVVRSPSVSGRLSTLFNPGAADFIDQSAYQAVFLANGSTYFGRLQVQGDEWFTLTDVFYLSASDQSGTQLIKRGSEPQGPREPMIIPRQQILFVENLRDDGDIVTAIRRFKSGQLPAATPPPATLAPTVAPTTSRPGATPTPTR